MATPATLPPFNADWATIQTPPQSPEKSPTKISSPSPYKNGKWKVRRSESGTINPYPPTPIKIKLFDDGIDGDVIYRFKHEDSGRRYFGSNLKTENGNDLIKRLGGYKHELNKEGKMRRRHITNAIRKDPEAFDIKIVAHTPQIKEVDLLKLEEAFQDKYDTRNYPHGYNKTRPTKEPLRSKKSTDSPPSTRKAAILAKEKLSKINY